MSKRGEAWLAFAMKVHDHIENYTVPQYGDAGDDQASEFTAADHVTQMKRYLNRHGKNSREGQDLLDMMKVAHYSQMAYDTIAEVINRDITGSDQEVTS